MDHPLLPPSSVLYLQILAKTAYFSPNASRMLNPDPVDVELILDPFLLNVLPESLLPVVAMIVLVAVAGWFLSGWMVQWLGAVAAEVAPGTETKKNI